MRFLLNDTRGLKVGSTRIWTHNLLGWLGELGCDASLNDWEHYRDYDVAIFGKSVPLERYRAAKQQNPGLLCGRINPSDRGEENREILKRADFYVVGSIEEQDYYRQYQRNAFIIPLVETCFRKTKVHEDHEPIVLGYHGDLQHLTEFRPFLTSALEQLARETPIKLLVVYNKRGSRWKVWDRGSRWKVGRPKIEIEEVQWELETIEEQLLRCDVGLVPGLVSIGNEEQAQALACLEQVREGSGGRENDYLLRFKCNSNAGRAFVFHQLGIPVVADFVPSNFHILGDPRNGFLAHSTQGWLYALEELCSSVEMRREMADRAAEAFRRLYDPMVWCGRFCEDLARLKAGASV